jgi:ubiquinone/menaquinone biosynthesis C-methylase UbiE
MGFYDRHVLPRLIALAMDQRRLEPYRRRLVRDARGRVLEVGVGSGANLPYYGPDLDELVALDPSEPLLDRARRQPGPARLRFVQATAEAMPLEDASFDTAVISFTLCSVPDAAATLAEVRRVLKPGGALLFAEHGRGPEPRVQRAQDRLTPLWRRIAGGCKLNLKIDEAIAAAGFRLDRLSTGYLGPRSPFTYIYEGRAVPNLHM